MADSGDNKTSTKPSKSITQDQILTGFEELRNAQRNTVGKMAELDIEKKEHE